MIYCRTDENGNIISLFETNNKELAKLNGYDTPCEREIVQVYNGTYKFAEDVTEEDFKPTQKQINETEIARLKSELSATDYKCLKYVDGALSESEYAETKAYRAELRQRINELQRTE